MPRLSLAGFTDPVRRPRFIIWTGVVVLMIASVMIVALGVTSTRWFCAQGCHKVQDDTIVAYQHSSHNKVSCMSCHMPVNADPATFLLHKMEALGELYLTVTNNFELPLNAHSHVAMEMPENVCTQCHSENRKITSSPGIIIDHEAHREAGVTCTMCHNRVAHVEDFQPTLKDPATGEPSHKHEDFMTMDACFRCHGLGDEAKAPGTCSACHPKGFDLKPANHKKSSFFPAGHADLAMADVERVKEAEAEAAEREVALSGVKPGLFTGVAAASGGAPEGEFAELKPVKAVSYCGTCHEKQKFCDGCHGMEMPHPAAFRQKEHPKVVKTAAKKCEYCHKAKTTKFCDECHHGAKVEWAFNKGQAWTRQHADAVREKGVDGCLGECHDTDFCSDCHNREKPYPSSHKARTWLRNKVTVTSYGSKAAAPSATHALSAQKEVTACEVCHGKGGASSKFCKGCHKLPMPHPQQFKEFHSGTGRKSPKTCANCHTFKELCSNCHHAGAKPGVSWTSVHPKTVSSGGAQPCFEKCHKDKDFCVRCHTRSNAVPTSHDAKGWTRRTSLSKPAGHPAAFKKSNDSCVYCHGEGGAKAKFCQNCHKLPMPHEFSESLPDDPKGAGAPKQRFAHKAGFNDKKLSRKTCQNCHTQRFCDNCHHKGSSPSVPWAARKAGVKVQHAAVVKKSGTADCFSCHKETFCSYCHVRLSR